MADVGAAIDALDDLQARFQKFFDELLEPNPAQDDGRQQTFIWLQRQITSRINQMKGLRLDLESGLSPIYLGYASTDDLLEAIQDIECELLALERTAKELEGMIRGK